MVPDDPTLTTEWINVVLEVEELRTLAYKQIIASLTPRNVFRELKTVFSRTFEQVRVAQIKYLRKNWVSATLDLSIDHRLT
jgi:hypothetical protein